MAEAKNNDLVIAKAYQTYARLTSFNKEVHIFLCFYGGAEISKISSLGKINKKVLMQIKGS